MIALFTFLFSLVIYSSWYYLSINNLESNNEIIEFCEKNYGVSFLLTEKIKVKGDEKHPLYQWLCSKSKNGKVNSSVKWNFQKYLVDTNGELINYFYSITNPLSDKITKHIR